MYACRRTFKGPKDTQMACKIVINKNKIMIIGWLVALGLH